MEALKQDVELYPDAYHYERANRFKVSSKGIFEALKRLGVSYKKTLKHPKAALEKRFIFCKKLKTYEKANRAIVFLDESGFAHDMPRCYGYAFKGERCFRIKTGAPKGLRMS